MHRIDGSTATPGNQFTEGSPTGGVPATIVSDDWLNDVQENLCHLIEQAGVTLTKGRNADLLDAVNALAAIAGSSIVSMSLSSNGYIRFRNPTNPAQPGLTLQWGGQVVGASSTATSLFPIAFQSEAYQIVASYGIPSLGTPGADPLSASQYRLANTHTTAQQMRWFAIGR